VGPVGRGARSSLLLSWNKMGAKGNEGRSSLLALPVGGPEGSNLRKRRQKPEVCSW